MQNFNRDLYVQPPSELNLLNEGVAKVSDLEQHEQTLRFEVKHFVCVGHYQSGMARILTSYLDGLGKPEQKSVWVSGFYGSGKSHFLKMLKVLWTDHRFTDGASARGVATLTDDVKDSLIELSNRAKQMGGLHAAAGTLTAHAGESVRLAILRILLQSRDLPAGYPQARLALWLRSEGKLDDVRCAVESSGHKWESALNHMYVSSPLAQAVMVAFPDQFASTNAVSAALQTQFPSVSDVGNDEMVEMCHRALDIEIHSKRNVPLTLLALDEVQQYIGDSQTRAMHVQEAVEALAAGLGSRLLVVASGQAALSSTKLLERLLGRFALRIELSDADVTQVIRQVILKKKPSASTDLKQMFELCSGEISRHLAGTRLASTADDQQHWQADYPLLPARRRFWEHVLRAVDKGITAQLRNQLTMVLHAVKETANSPLGHVVGGDFLFEQQAADMVQTSELPKEHYELIQHLRTQGEDGPLQSRICGLVFLIAKLPRSHGVDAGLRATSDSLTHLLVEDLHAGSAALKPLVDAALGKLTQNAHLLWVGDEYRLQTMESAEWEHIYKQQITTLERDATTIGQMRDEKLRAALVELPVHKGGLICGDAKVPRALRLVLSSGIPADFDKNLCVWIRDASTVTEKEVQSDAQKAGQAAVGIHAFVPAGKSDAIRSALIRGKAAEITLGLRAAPTTDEGREAHAAMASRKLQADLDVEALMGEAVSAIKVWLGGGQEISVEGANATLVSAGLATAKRLYSRFNEADDKRWGEVVTAARGRAKTALAKIGFEGSPEAHAVVKAVLAFVAIKKKGSEIRNHFTAPPYGWPGDAIDGALYVLAITDMIRVINGMTGAPLDLATVPPNQLGPHNYQAEVVVTTAAERLAVGKLAQVVGIKAHATDAVQTARDVVANLIASARAAGGDAPRPVAPEQKRLTELQALEGNAIVVGLAAAADECSVWHTGWSAAKSQIDLRMPRWLTLQQLLKLAEYLPIASTIQPQVTAIFNHRGLLQTPDPLPTLCDALTQELRLVLNSAVSAFDLVWESSESALKGDDNWNKITVDQRRALREQHQLLTVGPPKVGTETDVIASLSAKPFTSWADKTAALPARSAQARRDAAKLLEPKVIRCKVPTRTLRSTDDLDVWLADVRTELGKRLADGPIFVE